VPARLLSALLWISSDSIAIGTKLVGCPLACELRWASGIDRGTGIEER